MIRKIPTGIDISAEWFHVCALDKKLSYESNFPQGLKGFEALESWARAHGIFKMHACMEHTGGYETALALYLLEKGHVVSIVDPSRIRGHKACKRQKRKTDKLDAKAIAGFCKIYKPESWNPRPDDYQTLTHLVRYRDALIADQILWSNRLASPNDLAFVRTQTEATRQMLMLQTQLVEEQIHTHVEASGELKEAVEILGTCKGAKFWTAVKFLGEAGPISNYPTAQSLDLAAGLAAIPLDSGKAVGLRTVPIYGNLRLRQSLQMAATVAKVHNPALAQFADRLTKAGKPKRLVTKAVQRKMAEIFWAMLTKKEKFDPTKAVKNFRQP